MPNLRVHVYIDRLFFGKSYWKLHKEMDKPFKFLGRSHRTWFHDPASAYIIASRLYPDDPDAFWAALYHIFYDKRCSEDPEFRKYLEMMARLGSVKRRRKGKRKRRSRKRKRA